MFNLLSVVHAGKKSMGGFSSSQSMLLLVRTSSFGAAALVLSSAQQRRSFCLATAPRGAESSSPLLKFGVIADIQYCDIDDAENFSGTEFRRYRSSLEGAKKAVERFREEKVDFVAQLGDLIDGQNSGRYGAGLGRGRTAETALRRVLAVLNEAGPVYHAIGNHEWMCFSPEDFRKEVPEEKNFYYRIPSAGNNNVQFLVLNSYEISMELPENSEGWRRAAEMLQKENPKVVGAKAGTVDFFKDLEGSQLRFVPFNGAYGEKQLTWLRRHFEEARKEQITTVIFAHTPLHPKAASWRNVNYDAPEVLDLIEEFKDVVLAVFAGHSHRGGYYFDPKSQVHHTTVQATLTHESSFGIVDVYHDHLQLRGFGDLPSRTLSLSSSEEKPTAAAKKEE